MRSGAPHNSAHNSAIEASAHKTQQSGLLKKIDTIIMGCLFSPVLNYTASGHLTEANSYHFNPIDCAILGGRIVRNVLYTAYAPIQVGGFILSDPIGALKRVPEWLLQQVRAICSLEGVIAYTGASIGAAAALNMLIGCAAPIHIAVVISGLFATLISLSTGEMSRRHHGVLIFLESLFTGMALGLVTSWIMRRRFAEPVAQLQEELRQQHFHLPEGSSGFVNDQGVPVLRYGGHEATQAFLDQNPALARAVSSSFHKKYAIGNENWMDARYTPSQVLLGGSDRFSVGGSFSTGSTYHAGGSRTDHYAVWTFSRGEGLSCSMTHGNLAAALTAATQVPSIAQHRHAVAQQDNARLRPALVIEDPASTVRQPLDTSASNAEELSTECIPDA